MLSDPKWVSDLLSISSWPRELCDERLQIVCLNTAKNILAGLAADRMCASERRRVLDQIMSKIHSLLWNKADNMREDISQI